MSQRSCSYSLNTKFCLHCDFAMIFQFQLQWTGKSRHKWRKFCVQIHIKGWKLLHQLWVAHLHPLGCHIFFFRKLAEVMLSCNSLYLLMTHSHCLETAHSKFWNLIGFNKKNTIKLLFQMHYSAGKSTRNSILSLSSQNCTSPRGMVSFLKNILFLILITLPCWISFCLWESHRA